MYYSNKNKIFNMIKSYKMIRNFSIFVKSYTTPNPNFLKFVPGKQILENDNTYDINDKSKAIVSPLAMNLFSIDGINRVTYGPDFISVGKQEFSDWVELKPLVIEEIVKYLNSNQSIFNQKINDIEDDTRINENDSDVVKLIKEIISTRIRPNLQDDGGDIKYIDFDENEGIVYLKMKGTCSNCQHSETTFKNGIEKMLIHFVSEVNSVVELKDDE
jgi:Fe-S cluster biogenesis protein NfuA